MFNHGLGALGVGNQWTPEGTEQGLSAVQVGYEVIDQGHEGHDPRNQPGEWVQCKGPGQHRAHGQQRRFPTNGLVHRAVHGTDDVPYGGARCNEDLDDFADAITQLLFIGNQPVFGVLNQPGEGRCHPNGDVGP
ncbi:hypothetical protein [Xylella fastidiosa]|uniref:hypothetical protein n=2 Tax=Xylella fastidiosa TaxID=2371 RepID=UPI001F4ECACE|nr:hypothetical protein [Xylella fastidiosa]